ncbi:MAG: hypothetical protein JO068_15340 [Hyphomicrobiales bacterium]|nr:hypothetical protein [Hyphomicrobiales bacterium]
MPREGDAVKREERQLPSRPVKAPTQAAKQGCRVRFSLSIPPEPFRMHAPPSDRTILVLLQQHAEAHASTPVSVIAKLVITQDLGFAPILRMRCEARSEEDGGGGERRTHRSLEHRKKLLSVRWSLQHDEETLNERVKAR